MAREEGTGRETDLVAVNLTIELEMGNLNIKVGINIIAYLNRLVYV